MKKICSILLALILAIMPLTLCAAESTEKVTLNYYGWTDEQSYMTALINMFNEQNPDVEIVPTFVNHDDYNQKIVVLASSDSSVMDLVSCDSQATVLNLVTLDGLLPLKDRIEAAGIDMSAYGPIISETLFEDEYYGVPYRSTLYSLYYNKTLFDEMGLTAPTTWDELHETAKKLSIPGERWGFEVPIDQWFFCCFVRESGGELMNPEKTQLTVNNEAGAASLHWMRDMIEDGSMKAPPGSEYNGYEAARSDLSAGITTMIISSTGDLGTLRKICDFEVGTAFLPGNPNYGVVTGGANVCVLADHDDTAAGVAEFLKYLTSPDVAGQWAVTTGYVPTSEAAANSEAYQNFLKEVPAGVTALKQMEYAGNQPVIPQWAEIGATIITPEMQKCIEDSAYTPEMATQSMCDLVTTLLK